MKLVAVAGAVALISGVLVAGSADRASAQGDPYGYGPPVAPFVFSLIQPKVLVGRFSATASWRCVASSGYVAYVAYDTSKTRALNRLRALGYHNALCNHLR